MLSFSLIGRFFVRKISKKISCFSNGSLVPPKLLWPKMLKNNSEKSRWHVWDAKRCKRANTPVAGGGANILVASVICNTKVFRGRKSGVSLQSAVSVAIK